MEWNASQQYRHSTFSIVGSLKALRLQRGLGRAAGGLAGCMSAEIMSLIIIGRARGMSAVGPMFIK